MGPRKGYGGGAERFAGRTFLGISLSFREPPCRLISLRRCVGEKVTGGCGATSGADVPGHLFSFRGIELERRKLRLRSCAVARSRDGRGRETPRPRNRATPLPFRLISPRRALAERVTGGSERFPGRTFLGISLLSSGSNVSGGRSGCGVARSRGGRGRETPRPRNHATPLPCRLISLRRGLGEKVTDPSLPGIVRSAICLTRRRGDADQREAHPVERHRSPCLRASA